MDKYISLLPLVIPANKANFYLRNLGKYTTTVGDANNNNNNNNTF